MLVDPSTFALTFGLKRNWLRLVYIPVVPPRPMTLWVAFYCGILECTWEDNFLLIVLEVEEQSSAGVQCGILVELVQVCLKHFAVVALAYGNKHLAGSRVVQKIGGFLLSFWKDK